MSIRINLKLGGIKSSHTLGECVKKGIVSFIAIFIALVLCNNQAYFVNDGDFSPIPNFTHGNSNNSWLVSAGGYSSFEMISHMDIDSNGNVFVVGQIFSHEDPNQ